MHFARLCIGLESKDAKAVREAFTKLEQEFIWKETNRANPEDITFAVALMHFGGAAGMLDGLKELGFNNLADAMGPKMAEKCQITKSSASYGMIQRMGFCLNGVGQNLGTGGISQAKLLAPSAKKYLEKRGLSLTYDGAEAISDHSVDVAVEQAKLQRQSTVNNISAARIQRRETAAKRRESTRA